MLGPPSTPLTPGRTIPSAVLDQFLGPPAQATSHAEDEEFDLQHFLTGGEKN